MGGKKRKYISEEFGDKPVFLVFKKERDQTTLVSEGPFFDIDEARCTMKKLLSEGVCSWMVTYNEY